MRFRIIILYLSLSLFSCEDDQKKELQNNSQTESIFFEEVATEHSNITFINKITESASDNWIDFDYYYNGGGVAIGDINNDGLPDLYFTGNQVADALYLNKGDLVFEDITKSAIKSGIDGWHTGVTMADVNGDGYLDIYVSRSGYTMEHNTANLLYINNGDLTFTDQAEEFGLNDGLFSTQAAFFDYDLDGDLDAYVMNYPYRYVYRNKAEQLDLFKSGKQETDRFYVNENGKFTNKSYQNGINNHDHGLGIGISDINNDFYPDVYISNDLIGRDYLFMNINGYFKEEIRERVGHTSFYGMGIDIADFNNDGEMDIIQLDMAFSDHVRSKKAMEMISIEHFWNLVEDYGHYQYMVNSFQLNNGNATFSEISQLAGISQTNWSWAPLLADFDNNGYKDLFVTNGYKREVKNLDNFIKLKEERSKGKIDGYKALTEFETIKDANNMFQNSKNLKFKDVTNDWGLGNKVNSNGAAYADLDNDGDLDLVINNMDTRSLILENKINDNSNFISLAFRAKGKNPFMVGTKVSIYIDDEVQVQELFPTRGYLSSSDYRLHFGLGNSDKIDKIEIRWPNKKTSVLRDVKPNQHLVIDFEKTTIEEIPQKNIKPLFTNYTQSLGIKYRHTENFYNDFDREILLPHLLSRLGPCLEVADVNGDDLEDLFIGGAKGSASAVYLQNPNGTFSISNQALFNKEAQHEDVGALFFDFEEDGDLDLYVASGGNDFNENDPLLQDRLYINDGKGSYTKSVGLLPKMLTSTKAVKAIDFDHDNDLDLVVGERLIPGKYPHSKGSWLLENKNGKFIEVTLKKGGDLASSGQVTAIEIGDYDGNSWEDIALVKEWGGLEIYLNRNGQSFKRQEVDEATLGLWFSLASADIDNDGDLDLIGGNLGLNSKFKASVSKPFSVYAHDFDDNGTNDIVLSKYQDEVHYPVRGKKCSSEQMPFLADKFPTFESFAEADLTTIYGKELSKALHLKATNLASCVFINDGKGNFETKQLPIEAQLSPLQGLIVEDINNDGHLDILGAGNLFGAEIETVRYDAGRGICLLGDGKGNFKSLSPNKSGIFALDNVKSVVKIIVKGKPVYLLGVNNSSVMAYTKN